MEFKGQKYDPCTGRLTLNQSGIQVSYTEGHKPQTNHYPLPTNETYIERKKKRVADGQEEQPRQMRGETHGHVCTTETTFIS